MNRRTPVLAKYSHREPEGYERESLHSTQVRVNADPMKIKKIVSAVSNLSEALKFANRP